MLPYEFVKPLTAAFHSFRNLIIYNELQLLWLRKIRAGRCSARRAKIDLIRCQGSENEFVHAESGCPVHARVFAQEARDTIIVDNNYTKIVSLR